MKEGDFSKDVNVLDPKFGKEIENILTNVNKSISNLYEKATKDEKTGVYNNKFFQNVANMEIDKAKRGHQKLCLFILDIDHFKKINDTYGHVKADEMLAELGKVLRESTRESDIAARFGGEEFVVLFTETDLDAAKEVTLRIRNAIKKNSFLKKYKLTVSGGLTEYKKGDTLEGMLARADGGLYAAKEGGRDRFVAVGKKKKITYESGEIKELKKEPKMLRMKKLSKSEMIKNLRKAYG